MRLELQWCQCQWCCFLCWLLELFLGQREEGSASPQLCPQALAAVLGDTGSLFGEESDGTGRGRVWLADKAFRRSENLSLKDMQTVQSWKGYSQSGGTILKTQSAFGHEHWVERALFWIAAELGLPHLDRAISRGDWRC